MLVARLRKFRSGFTTEEWMELFERQDASGLSQSEFCKRENLSPKTFGNKRRLLGFEGGHPLDGGRGRSGPSTRSGRQDGGLARCRHAVRHGARGRVRDRGGPRLEQRIKRKLLFR